jgi:DNA mismatch repair protein MutL
MPGIRLLAPSVAELIAAGEVVERPASIVKELVENSLDAGATRIQVEIKNGGVRYIRVTDDGCGIPFDELPTAFVRHATSKIVAAEDLDAILTLGFRGEALASVAAMCRVEMLSRQPESDMGGRIQIEGGDVLLHERAGCPVGTTIVVRDIFYNTPARMKFLKKDIAEAAQVSHILERLALINPGVSFSYIRDGKRLFTTPGDGLVLSAVRMVLGSDLADGLLPVDFSGDGIGVSGFITMSNRGRPTRAMQYFYINGRTVQSRLLTGALEEAYRQRLVGGRFPGCVLNLTIQPGAVDVNVHPAKTEVRFSDERRVYNALYSACKETLTPPAARPAPAMSPFALGDFDYSDKQQALSGLPPLKGRMAPAAFSPDGRDRPSSAPASDRRPVSGPAARPTQPAARPDDSPAHLILRDDTGLRPPPERPPIAAIDSPPPEDGTPELPPVEQPATTAQDSPPDFRVIGELFGTYILTESGEDFYLIDKHAAHERYLYNRLLDSTEGIERQTLLTPLTVHLPKSDYAAAVASAEEFAAMGLVFDDFGEGTLLLREVPMLLATGDPVAAVAEMAAAVSAYRRDITPSYVAGLLASVACRTAVMAGDRSSEGELAFIAGLVLGGEATHCPHGRPTSRRFSRREIERMFGRLT